MNFRNSIQIQVILIVTFFIDVTVCNGQSSKTYIVQRGETIESIARSFNITVEELKKANMDMDLFYTGLEIYIPAKLLTQSQSMSGSQSVAILSSYKTECEIADRLFEAREYKKAQKQYQRIIKEYKDILPCEEALYSNAICSYNRGKWKTAIEDLSLVVNNRNCSDTQRRHCKDLLAQAKTYREQQLENRANIWGEILTTATATMNQMYGGGYAMTPQTYSVPSYSGTIADQMSQPGYFNDVYNQMIQQTMSQAQQQQWNEYQNAQSFFQKMGTNITFEEYQQGLINGFNTVVPQLNVNWNNIDWNNVNWNNIDSQSVDSYDMTTYSGNSPGNSTGTTTSRDILNSSGGGDCLLCHGDGKCFNCHGNGISNNMGITKTCETCKNDPGVCPQCHGTKVASWNR